MYEKNTNSTIIKGTVPFNPSIWPGKKALISASTWGKWELDNPVREITIKINISNQMKADEAVRREMFFIPISTISP